MKITILTIAPEQFDSCLKTPLVSRSISAGLLDLKIKDIRDYAPGSFRKVDDSPYGGGAGMLLRYQPLHDALIDNMSEKSHSILLAPCGKTYKQKDAHRLSKMEDLILICGLMKASIIASMKKRMRCYRSGIISYAAENFLR